MKKNRTIVAGRKPTLETDSQLTERVCALLGEGLSIKSSCNLCGVSERAYHEWTRRGQAGEEPYVTFFDAASRARDSWKFRLLRRLNEADDTRVIMWTLERCFPAEFCPKHEESQRGSNGLLPPSSPAPIINVTIQRDKATDEARKRFGEPPPEKRRCGVLGEGNVPLNST